MAHYSCQRMKLQGKNLCLGHSCSSDAPEENRETCVIQLRMLQENAVVTTQLSCTYQLSPFGKDNLHFLKAKYLQLFICPSRILFPLHMGFPEAARQGSDDLLTVSITRCQMSAFTTAQASRHRLTAVLQVIDSKVKQTWLYTKDLVELSDTNKHLGKAQMSPQK